jgi:hypothetical protein
MATSIELLKMLVEQGKATLKLQTQQLTVLEKQLWELENPVETRPLSDAEMKKRVLAFETRLAFKSPWKKAVNEGLLDNVQSLVNECQGQWRIKESGLDSEKVVTAAKKLGANGSLPWQLFTLQIIKRLHSKGSFWHETYFDTYEDTAGGCDEIVWDEGCKILAASE